MNKAFGLSSTAVFVAEIPSGVSFFELYPKERNDEISKTANEGLKSEKYCAWRLLEYAIKEKCGVGINEIAFKKNENGKWTADSVCFSLSHSNGVVAVAISDQSVGVDIEPLSTRRAEGFAKRILAESEFQIFSKIPPQQSDEYLITKWTEKEALFKLRDLSAFIPSKTVIKSGEYIKTETLTVNEKKHICSVAVSEGCEKVDFTLIEKFDI